MSFLSFLEEMEDVYIRCPVSGCNDSVPGNWFHKSCGGRMKFRYRDSALICRSCGHQNYIENFNYDCGRH